MVLPLLMIAAAGLGAVGKLVGGASARDAAKARASALEAASRQALQEGGVAAQMGLTEDERTIAHATTQAAKGGGGFGGSTLNVLDDLARQQTFRARSTIYGARKESYGLLTDARASRVEGSNAMLEGIIGAGGSLLSGFANAAMAKTAAAAARRGKSTVY